MSMEPEPARALEVFYSYAQEDETLKQKLETHLSLLRRQGAISSWHDHKIMPGSQRQEEVDTHLNAAQLILFLVSPDFIALDYCYGPEIKQALARHEAGKALVIPVLLRAADWGVAPFSHLQALPVNALPVTLWRDQDNAFLNVARGIRQAAELLTTRNSPWIPLKDFLIIYHYVDLLWVEWIAWQLEDEGYSVVLQALGPAQQTNSGEVIQRASAENADTQASFSEVIQKASTEAERTIVVLSPDSLNILERQPEWALALRGEQTGQQNTLISIHVHECRDRLRGLTALLTSIDLVGKDEQAARETLLAGIHAENSRARTVLNPTTKAYHLVSEQPRFPAPIWNIPYAQNTFFVDREDTLKYLHNTFAAGTKTTKLTQPQAISGLGGIGKTQIAVEYAYRYRSDYQALLWVNAETYQTLLASFTGIAHLLKLPEKDEQEQATRAVLNWLRDHTNWLLILDNADDLILVRDFMPSTPGGHVLITTRAQATGRIGQGIHVSTMEAEDGALFLLHRAKIIKQDAPLSEASEADRSDARAIHELVGGLPLALDQAAAFIEETGNSLADYLKLYQTQSTMLLERRGALALGHPKSVAATWSLSFEKVAQSNPTARALLCLCSFLRADGIPEEIITQGAYSLGPELARVVTNPLELDDAIAELRKYSLVRRNPRRKILTMHRLVQATLRNSMDERMQRQWGERAVKAVNHVFPEVEFVNWHQCQRCLPQALTCADLIREYQLIFLDAAHLLYRAGVYLTERAEYAEAEPLLEQSLALCEQLPAVYSAARAQSLHALATLYVYQGRYTEARPRLQEALTIREQLFGDNPATAQSLDLLATLYLHQGMYAEAETLLERALTICEQSLGNDDPATAQCLDSLATLYLSQERYAAAEPLLERALAIREQQGGSGHPDTAWSLSNLAMLYATQGKYTQAEALQQRALATWEQQLGSEHPLTASGLDNLATLYSMQKKYDEAILLYERALQIRREVLDEMHPDRAHSLDNLATLYEQLGKHTQAEPLFLEALTIYENRPEGIHPRVATVLNKYAALLEATGRASLATALRERARTIQDTQTQNEPAQ